MASCSMYMEKQTNVAGGDIEIYCKKKRHKVHNNKSMKRKKIEMAYLRGEENKEHTCITSVEKQLNVVADKMNTYRKKTHNKEHCNKSMKRKIETTHLKLEENNDDSANTSADKNTNVGIDGIQIHHQKKRHQVHLRPSCEYLKTLRAGKIDYTLLNNIAAYEEARSEILKSKLEEVMLIQIKISWIVPITHRSSGRNFKTEIQKYGRLKVRVGPFSPDEDKLIIRNWEMFQEMSGIQDAQTMKVFHLRGSPNRVVQYKKLQFYQFIGRGLDNRLLKSISDRFWKLMEPMKYGRFSEEESALVVHFIEQYGKNFKFLSKLLKKPYLIVLQHYKMLTDSTDPVHQKYTIEEDEKLGLSVLKHSQCKTAAEVVEKEVPWKEVAKDLCRTTLSVQYRWTYHLKIMMRIRKPITLFEINCKMIYRLLDLNVKHWQDVDWEPLTQEIIGLKSGFLPNRLHTLVKAANIPDFKQKTLRECLEYLRDYWIPCKRQRPPRTKIIPLVIDKDGKLVPKDDSDNEEDTRK